MSTRRILTTVAAAAAATLALGTTAVAEPVDLVTDSPTVCLDRGMWDVTATGDYFPAFMIDEGAVWETAGCTGAEIESDAFDGLWAVWLEQNGDGAYYGDTDGVPTWVADQTTAANGDVVITGPVEQHFGLDVQVELRFYVDGDMARVLATYTNPTAAPITVATGTDSGYGSDDGIRFLATSSGDAAVTTAADSWAVTDDGGEGDPVLANAWQLPGAAWQASQLDIYGVHGTQDNMTVGGAITVPAGGTVRLAYFTKMYGYAVGQITEGPGLQGSVPGDEDKSLQATYVGGDVAAADTQAITDTSEWASFSGRLTAGLADGTVVANWGTVGGAAPATPVIAPPAFTG